MTSPTRVAADLRPADVERWLAELGVEPLGRADREGITSWDLELDGRRRFDLRVTLILDPHLALICWVHYAPPIGDAFRKSYRKLLRWNDEFPFAKFSLAEDERPILAAELPIASVNRDDLGLALARLLWVSDQLLEESASWLWIGSTVPADYATRTSRNGQLLDRFAAQLPEPMAPEAAAPEPTDALPTAPDPVPR
jgi:hypothetical protein